MDDFEYSVEISDRDWESFFVECEECDLLPPSLAGVDDSGMSDIDDHFLAQKAQRVNSTTRFSENDLPVDSTPDSEGSPVEHGFGKPGISGIDSVLSGSEEDIHMQSINVFFEKLKGLTEVQPSQERAGNNKEAMQEQERCGDGQQAIRRTSPKTCPKFNLLPDRGGTGGGKQTVRSVDTIRPSKTITAEATFSSSTSALSRSKPAELFVKVETVGNGLTQLNQRHDSTEQVVWSEMTPQSHKEELCRSMEKNSLLTSQEIHNKKCSGENHVYPQETSPSVSMKRKRRKKRRLSVEVCEDEEECDRRVLVKQVGTKEEPHSLREGASLCLSKETFDYLKEPQKSSEYLYTPIPATINLLKNLSAHDEKNKLQRSASPRDTQNLHLHQRSPTAVSAAEKCSAQHRSEPHPTQSEGDVTSAASSPVNEAADLQPCSKLQVEESSGRNLPVSSAENPKSQQRHEESRDLHQAEKIQNSVSGCKNEQNLKYSTAPVKAVGLLTNTESCAPGVQLSQNDNLSAAKSVLAAEAGNSCRDKRTLCRGEAEPQQQLESDCHNTNQCHAALENTCCSVSAPDEVTSHPMTRPSPHETSDDVVCSDFTSDCIYQLPISCLSKNQSGADTEQQLDHPIEVQASDILLQKDVEVDRTQQEPSQTTALNVQTSPSVITYVSSCCALDSESIKPTNQTESSIKKLRSEGQETFAAPKQPEKTGNSVFAMSSFWNEMEKLTINDILGLRQIAKAAPPSLLPPVQEREETEMFPVTDSGFFNQVDESKPEQITEEVTDSPALRSVSWECEPVPVSPGSVIYSHSPTLTSVSDTSQPVLTERAQKCLRKISKTVSVHNLQALESGPFSYTSKNETMNILEERESENFAYIPENIAPKKEKEANVLPSPSTGSYSISFTDIFQYLFGGKQSVSSQSATDDKDTFYTGGSSVPETYDQFFSEFDDENFFYPLITAEEKNKDQLVPIFSYSRSTCRNLQFPEAYEHFFASSSSDDSSVESEEEDHCSPVRVVSRFTRKASSTQLSKDMYEDFFSDKDLRENFFSLKSLSFRKMTSTAPTVQNESSNSLVPVKHSPWYTMKIGSRLNVLGNQDGMFPDPLLEHLENRISHQLTQQPFRYEDLQATVSNPRSDAPLLPLKQSDMCLVCIAFASWVLKTANPQVGDAWKAVLLANVSALSAIRYLRKYVRVEAAAGEIEPHQKALKDS